jgi:arabinose-5-phosphate isomerase
VNRLERAHRVLEMEAKALLALRDRLGSSFEAAVDLVLSTEGHAVVAGIGKSGLIGAKISATLASTGTPSFFLHPSEAIHGDLGRVRARDVVILISNSGETEEVLRLVDPLRRIGARLLAMTGGARSSLARASDIVLDYGEALEACPLGLAPTTSTAVLLGLGDALAMALVEERRFGTVDYAVFHPGGSLGRKLLKVSEIMRRGEWTTVVHAGRSARETLIAMNATRGRPGAAMIVDAAGRLVGLLTDGDLARNLQSGVAFLEEPVERVMTPRPLTIRPERLASEAWHVLQERRVDQLPVVGDDGVPLGLLDVQDLLAARVMG